MVSGNKDRLLFGVRNHSKLMLFAVLLSVVGSAQAQKKTSSRGWAVNTKVGQAKDSQIPMSNDAEVSKPPVKTEEKHPIQLVAPSEAEKNVIEVSAPQPETPAVSETPIVVESPAISQSKKAPIRIDRGLFDTAVEKPTTEPIIALKPSINLNLQFNEILNRQFQAIQELAETEDSFSEQFGELYLAYARSLLKVGRLEEARVMFTNALHNAKVNNGVNSLEQRPVLRELFEMSLAVGNASEAEAQLKRIIWIDNSAPKDDTFTFELILKLANYYLDQYLMTPSTTEVSLIALYKSIRYYGYAIRRYDDTPLNYKSLPYGDLAYAHYLKAIIRSEVDDGMYVNARKRSYTNIDKHDSRIAIDHSFPESDRYLRQAYEKAKSELDFESTLEALLSLGDLHLLYGSPNNANIYYQLARKSAKHLPLLHPMVQSFDGPVKLPAFKLTVERDPLSYGRSYQIVPMLLDINSKGYISRVSRQEDMEIPMGVRIRANRTAKKLRFRPTIEQGKLVPIADHEYDVRVAIRRTNAVANEETKSIDE